MAGPHQQYINNNPNFVEMATGAHMQALGFPAAEALGITPQSTGAGAVGPEGQPIVTHIA